MATMNPITKLIKTGQARAAAEKTASEDKTQREIAAHHARWLDTLINNCVNILGVGTEDVEVVPVDPGFYVKPLVKVGGWTFTTVTSINSFDPATEFICAVADCESCGKRLYSRPMQAVGKHYSGADLVLADIDQAPPSKWGREAASTTTDTTHVCPNKGWLLVDTRSGAARELKAKIDEPVTALREALSVLGYAVTHTVKKGE
jgi:hypothetical protein